MGPIGALAPKWCPGGAHSVCNQISAGVSPNTVPRTRKINSPAFLAVFGPKWCMLLLLGFSKPQNEKKILGPMGVATEWCLSGVHPLPCVILGPYRTGKSFECIHAQVRREPQSLADASRTQISDPCNFWAPSTAQIRIGICLDTQQWSTKTSALDVLVSTGIGSS